MKREVHSILGPLGVNESLSRLVAEDLRTVEDDTWGRNTDGNEGVVSVHPRRKPRHGDAEKKGWRIWRKRTEEENGGVKGNDEMGLTAFLLKFGEGIGGSPLTFGNLD